MSHPHEQVLKTVALADRLEADIRDKGLREGDPYFSTQDASRFLGVAGNTANKVLQLLEKRRVIQRRQRVGAVILAPPDSARHDIERVHFLVHEKYLNTEGIGADGILLGLQPMISPATVNLCFLQPGIEEQQVGQLIDQSLRTGGTDAFVLVRTPYEVQRIIADCRLPAVVHGACYTGIANISNIDRDHAQVANLVLSYVRERKRTRPALLMRQTVLPGDKKLLDTLTLDPLGWRLRFTPTDDEAIMAEYRELLHGDNPPDIIVCQTRRHAKCLQKIMAEMNLAAERDLDILVLHYYLVERGEFLFPHIVSDMSAHEIGKRIGELLMAASRKEAPLREIIPVRLSR